MNNKHRSLQLDYQKPPVHFHTREFQATLDQEAAADYASWARMSFDRGEFDLAISDQQKAAVYYKSARQLMGIEKYENQIMSLKEIKEALK